MNFSKIKGLDFLDAQKMIEEFEFFKDDEEFADRLKKTLYYGKLPSKPRPSLPLTEVTVELFAKAVPKVHLDVLDIHYASSISRKASLSPCSMMLALMYLERLRRKNPEYLQTVSSCDLFLVSMMVASKYLCDDSVFNDDWAESAGMDLKDLNHLEKEFLSAMEWELFIKPAAFFDFLTTVETRLAKCEGSKRSWLTYTEICILMQRLRGIHIWEILLEDFSKVIIVSGLAYMSAVVTLVAATALALKCCALIPTTSQSVSSHLPCIERPTWQLLLESRLADQPSAANRSDAFFDLELLARPCHALEYRAPPRHRTHQLAVGLDPSEAWWGQREESRRRETSLSAALWNTFKYWPTCCGIQASGFL